MPVKFLSVKDWEALGLPKETTIFGSAPSPQKDIVSLPTDTPSKKDAGPTKPEAPATDHDPFMGLNKIKQWPATFEDNDFLCVPKIRFCNIGGEGHRELGVT